MWLFQGGFRINGAVKLEFFKASGCLIKFKKTRPIELKKQKDCWAVISIIFYYLEVEQLTLEKT